MKTLTLYQPWATLVAIGAKKIETRSWGTSYRGPLAIHAGKNTTYVKRGESYICDEEPFYSVLMAAGAVWKLGALPLGAIVATCELVDVKRIDKYDWRPGQQAWVINRNYWEATEQERSFGDYTVGRYMWFLGDIKILPEPIYVPGAMGLWEWEGKRP